MTVLEEHLGYLRKDLLKIEGFSWALEKPESTGLKVLVDQCRTTIKKLEQAVSESKQVQPTYYDPNVERNQSNV